MRRRPKPCMSRRTLLDIWLSCASWVVKMGLLLPQPCMLGEYGGGCTWRAGAGAGRERN